MKKHLVNILIHAKNNIPFYQKCLYGIDEICENNVYEIMKKIPIVSKSDIKKDIKSFVSKDLNKKEIEQIFDYSLSFRNEYRYKCKNGEIVSEYTSGTNGMPFICAKSIHERLVLGKLMLKNMSTFYPASPDLILNMIHNYSGKEIFPNFKHLTFNERIENEIKCLEYSQYTWWHVNPRILSSYNNFIKDKKIKFKYLRAIENSGAYLDMKDKEEYSKNFGVPIVDNYGCREVWNIAYDCKCGSLHVNEPFIFLEIVDENGIKMNEANQYGQVVITSTVLKTMPFIRYSVGDVACYSESAYECSNTNKSIRLLPGRSLIAGTNIYGEIYFRNIIQKMLLFYDVKKFDDICILQRGLKVFEVYIYNCRESREKFENAFMEASYKVFMHSKYKYKFVYDSNYKPKSLFTVALMNEVNL